MYSSKRAVLLSILAALPGLVSCGSSGDSAQNGMVLERTAWLGSAQGWGLLGLPVAGGALTYRSAETLASPTWAPPELEALSGAWPGRGAIWLQFDDSRIARYDYATGHLLSFEGFERTVIATTLDDARGLVVAPEGHQTLELVSETDDWRFPLPGELSGLARVGDGQVIAVVDSDSTTELLVVEAGSDEPLSRRTVERVQALAVAPSGERLYVLSTGEGDPIVHGLTLPDLEEAEAFGLPEPGRTLAVTPSGHRIYVAVGERLYVFDRIRGTLLRSVATPGSATALRFSTNGANLMARLDDGDQVAVFQVGVDSLLGVVSTGWSDNLPVALPGGRLVAADGADLVLYDILRLVEIARAQVEDARLWLAVEWQPPRPRVELAQRTARRSGATAASTSAAHDSGAPRDPEAGAAPGYYAVVSAAREQAGVENLVAWLRSVGYSGTVDRHVDAMGVVWHRAMVGPYADRELAEEAARSLSARYGYKPWILTVTEEAAGAVDTPAGSAETREEGGDETTGVTGEGAA